MPAAITSALGTLKMALLRIAPRARFRVSVCIEGETKAERNIIVGKQMNTPAIGYRI
jgi:hypothetical protein